MGNACETYCSYEESSQLNLGGLRSEQQSPDLVKYPFSAGKNQSRKTVFNKNLRSIEEKNTYWLRGYSPQKNISPIRASIRPVKRIEERVYTESPPQINIVQVKAEDKEIVIEDVEQSQKKRRKRKLIKGKFPFEYIPNIETDQIYPEKYIFTQRLNVNGDKSRYNSPKRDKPLTHEEKISCILNNKINNFPQRPPPLANEIIITQQEIIRRPPVPIEQPKRLKYKDASIQFEEKGYNFKGVQTDQSNIDNDSKRKKLKPDYKLTDVSTATEPTPLKQRPVEQPEVIKEEKIKVKKKPIPKKKEVIPTVEDYQIHEIYIDPDEEILLEGEMLKFKPGIERNFIQRWIQLSTRSLRYYKNHYHSICYLTRPISAIPLYAIEKVHNFQITNQDYMKRDKEKYSFLFEVVLKQDYEDIYFFREFEINGVTNNSPSILDINQRNSPGRKSSDSRGRRSGSPYKYSLQKSSDNGQVIVTNTGELNGVVMPTRMMFISPSRSKKNDYSPPRDQSVMSSNTQHDKVTRIIQGHLMPIRDLNKGAQKEHYIEDQNIINKEFGEPLINSHGQNQTYTWSNRQHEWYNSERRFIFSCRNEQERKKWMTAIKLAASKDLQRLRTEREEKLNQEERESQVQMQYQEQEIMRGSGHGTHSMIISSSAKGLEDLV